MCVHACVMFLTHKQLDKISEEKYDIEVKTMKLNERRTPKYLEPIDFPTSTRG